MGGQSALNVGIELWKNGVFEKYDCKVLGTTIETIISTEDRNIFASRLRQINEFTATSFSAESVEEAISRANEARTQLF